MLRCCSNMMQFHQVMTNENLNLCGTLQHER